MDSFKNYITKHKWLFWISIVIEFFIIFLPQWLDAIWDLAEKYEGRTLTMPHPSLSWMYLTVPVGLAMFVITIWAIRSKKVIEVKTEAVEKSVNLTDTLTAMHRRLVELQKEKASHTKIRFKQWEIVMPTLSDRMGTVKFKDWYIFKRNLESRIRKASPRRNFKRTFNFIEFVKWRERVHLAALSVAVEVRDELFHSKEWTFEDGTKMSEWLDGYDWGVKILRDNDLQWRALYESISHYLKDEVLRKLIERHIDFSYFYNNESLVIYYSHKFQNDAFSLMLYETLVGSPISPEKAELALSEVLSEIEKRLVEIGDSIHLGIEVTKTRVEPVQINPQSYNAAICVEVNLKPYRAMQLSFITLDISSTLLENGRELLSLSSATPKLPDLLEYNGTYVFEFQFPLEVNGLPKIPNLAALWEIHEMMQDKHDKPRSKGILKIRADAKEWPSAPFVIPN